MKIDNNKYVALQYELYAGSAEARDLVEQTTPERPFEFIYGMGMVLPAFEKNLFGLEEGDKFDFTLSVENGYGAYQEEYVMPLNKEIFVNAEGKFDEEVIFEGNVIPMMDSEGNQLMGLVKSVEPATVVVDFNHPLAGKELHFVGVVETVREATEEDINKFFGGQAGGCGSGCGDGGSCGCSGCGH